MNMVGHFLLGTLVCATMLSGSAAAFAQDAVRRCASILPDAPALARSVGAGFKYPEAAFVAGREGTVGYQYRLVDSAGKVSVDCIYMSSGDAEIDADVVRRINASTYFLPKMFSWPRDAGRVYQDTSTVSWNSERLQRTKGSYSVAADRLIYEPPVPAPDFRYKVVNATTLLVGHVAETGTVDMVSMRKSSGDYQLDAIAMESVLTYKFKPGEAFTFERAFNFKNQ